MEQMMPLGHLEKRVRSLGGASSAWRSHWYTLESRCVDGVDHTYHIYTFPPESDSKEGGVVSYLSFVDDEGGERRRQRRHFSAVVDVPGVAGAQLLRPWPRLHIDYMQDDLAAARDHGRAEE